MSPSQFYKLDEAEQAELIWEGKHVGSRQTEEYSVLLYKIQELYVEVFLHKKYNVIHKFEAFIKDEIIDVYWPKN